MFSLEKRLPIVSAGIAFDIQAPFFLRSLTINPVFSDEQDGSSRTARALWHTLAFRGKATSVQARSPVCWIELQIATNSELPTLVPEFEVVLSDAFDSTPSQLRDWLRLYLPQALTIINATTRDETAVEAAYGQGAVLNDAQTDCATPENRDYLAIRRPNYTATRTPTIQSCFFAAAVCRKTASIDKKLHITLKACPVDRRIGCPRVDAPIKLMKGETLAFWMALQYPPPLVSLTADERRFMWLRVGWTRRPGDPEIQEVLSFPRIASRFRVLATTPAYAVSPTLPSDPPAWKLQGAPTFALEAVEVKPRDLGDYCDVGLFLALEDIEDQEQRQRQYVLVSIVFGAVIGTILSTFLAALIAKSLDASLTIIFILLLVVFFVVVIFLLMPKSTRTNRSSSP